MTDRSELYGDRRPESAIGDSAAGASGGRPAGRPDAAREARSDRPDHAPGDPVIERRMGHQPGFRGPERRISAK